MNHDCQEKQNTDTNLLRKKSFKKEFIYDKVDNFKRAELLRLVIIFFIISQLKEEKKTLKESSEILKINYSTAKTIIRVFRKEQRIFKKSSLKEDVKFVTKKEDNSTSAILNTKSSFDSVNENIFKINKANNEIATQFKDSPVNSLGLNSMPQAGYTSLKTFSEKLNRDLNSCARIINQVFREVRENQIILENLLNISFHFAKKLNH